MRTIIDSVAALSREVRRSALHRRIKVYPIMPEVLFQLSKSL